jgi:hypothetical protein
MSAPQAQPPAPAGRVTVAAGPLWAGGVATACVAALVAGVGVLFFNYVFDVDLVGTALLLPISDSLALNYAVTAFLLGLAATGLAHLLSLTTPRPRVFFAWIVGLVTVAAMVVPFAFEGDLIGKVGTAVINLVIGISIASLLRSVLARTVVDAARSWQKR